MVNSNDLSLVFGIVLVVFAIPSLLNAWTSDRPPRFGAIIGLTGLVLIAMALTRHPGGYSPSDIPGAFRRVINGLLG